MELKNLLPISWLIVFVNAAAIHWERPEYFCGTDIANFLSKHCLEHNDYRGGSENYHIASTDGISNDCCTKPCSKRFMLEEFCKKVKDETKRELVKLSRGAEKNRKNHIVPKFEAEDQSMEDILLRTRSPQNQEMPNEIPRNKPDFHGPKRSAKIGYDGGIIIPINTNSNDNINLFSQSL